jgi:hypothetical protein
LTRFYALELNEKINIPGLGEVSFHKKEGNITVTIPDPNRFIIIQKEQSQWDILDHGNTYLAGVEIFCSPPLSPVAYLTLNYVEDTKYIIFFTQFSEGNLERRIIGIFNENSEPFITTQEGFNDNKKRFDQYARFFCYYDSGGNLVNVLSSNKKTHYLESVTFHPNVPDVLPTYVKEAYEHFQVKFKSTAYFLRHSPP